MEFRFWVVDFSFRFTTVEQRFHRILFCFTVDGTFTELLFSNIATRSGVGASFLTGLVPGIPPSRAWRCYYYFNTLFLLLPEVGISSSRSPGCRGASGWGSGGMRENKQWATEIPAPFIYSSLIPSPLLPPSYLLEHRQLFRTLR